MKKFILVFLAICVSAGAFAQSQTIRAFSHRGGRLERDENTAVAFQESWDAGYTGFETDIRMTKDGVLYLTHDHTLERTTNGTGVFEEKTAAEIDRLRTKKGNKIMTLEEFCKFLDGKENLYVEFEMKTAPKELYPQARLEDYVEKVYRAVKALDCKNAQFVFTSSDYRGLRYLQEHHPDAELLLIISKPLNDETIAIAKTVGIYTLGCRMEGTSRAMVEKAKKEGITVSLWPGLSVDDFLLGAYLGSDRMCTDVPLEVMKFMNEKCPWIKVVY
jgi:glycerophosphoryl diester phosphodiesterase